MQTSDDFRTLNFERQRSRSVPRGLIPYVLVLGLFTLLWVLVPTSVLYWLTLPVLAVLVWVASYGWRQALAALIQALEHLEGM